MAAYCTYPFAICFFSLNILFFENYPCWCKEKVKHYFRQWKHPAHIRNLEKSTCHFVNFPGSTRRTFSDAPGLSSFWHNCTTALASHSLPPLSSAADSRAHWHWTGGSRACRLWCLHYWQDWEGPHHIWHHCVWGWWTLHKSVIYWKIRKSSHALLTGSYLGVSFRDVQLVWVPPISMVTVIYSLCQRHNIPRLTLGPTPGSTFLSSSSFSPQPSSSFPFSSLLKMMFHTDAPWLRITHQ